jgi:hypothetical protein
MDREIKEKTIDTLDEKEIAKIKADIRRLRLS